MDPSPLWAHLLLAAGSLLMSGVAGSAAPCAPVIADELNVRQVGGASDLIGSATDAAGVSGRDGRAPSDSPAARFQPGGAAPGARATGIHGGATGGGWLSATAVTSAPHDGAAGQRPRPTAGSPDFAGAMRGCGCARLAAGPFERGGAARRRDVRDDETSCSDVQAATGIDRWLRLLAQQFGAPVTQLLDEYQAYRAGWQGRD